MFRRIVFSALLAGLCAGLVLSVIQSFQVVPIILEAEAYETAGAATAEHHQGNAAQAHDHGEEWAPTDGIERTLYTLLSNVLTAIGFGLLLGAMFALRKNVSATQGLLWGLGGFAVFFALPSIGLPPEIPGTVAAELSARQTWWLLTVCCSGAGLALLALHSHRAWKLAGLALLVVPHIIGAPHPEVASGNAPEELAVAFIVATGLANAAFWLVLGAANGFFFKRLA